MGEGVMGSVDGALLEEAEEEEVGWGDVFLFFFDGEEEALPAMATVMLEKVGWMVFFCCCSCGWLGRFVFGEMM